MPAASAPWVNAPEVWPPCRPPVVSDDCCSTSATLLKPRVWMSSAVMDITGVWVFDLGLRDQRTGDGDPCPRLVALSWAIAGAAAIRAEIRATASVLRRAVLLTCFM